MCKAYWWSEFGPFNPYRECPTRPDPREVLHFYLEKRSIQPNEQIAYFIDLLDLQKSMVYQILKGIGFDSIDRCRILVQALKIHPPLLGIDAKFYPIENYVYWWDNYGFSFDADIQGYPMVHKVLLALRSSCLSLSKEKSWTQQDLADACGLRHETIYRMEQNRNALILDTMSRRAMIASVFGSLFPEKEPIIFRLFGLDPQAYGVPVPADEFVPVEVHDLPYQLTDTKLHWYRQEISPLFTQYYTGHMQDLERVRELLRLFDTLLKTSAAVEGRVSLLALQCHCHRLIAGVAREQCQRDEILFHTDRAVNLAEQALALSSLSSGSELLVTALLWRAEAYYELEEYETAQTDIDVVLHLLSHVQSSQLRVYALSLAGLIRANTAHNGIDCFLVLSYFNLAMQNVSGTHLDDHFLRCDTGVVHLYKAIAFFAPQMMETGAIGESVSCLLEKAQMHSSPDMMRQQIVIEVFQAVSFLASCEYKDAVESLLSALEKSRQIQSRLNRNRIEKVYRQLLDTSFRGNPRLAYLGMKLRTWDYGGI